MTPIANNNHLKHLTNVEDGFLIIHSSAKTISVFQKPIQTNSILLGIKVTPYAPGHSEASSRFGAIAASYRETGSTG
jgi:hypothetical protein